MKFTLTKTQVLSVLGSILLSLAGLVAADVKAKSDRVPVLDSRTEVMYNEIQALRQQQTELLIVLYGALGDLKRAAELQLELKSMKAEAETRKGQEDKK